jgi:hypothetical protein
MYGDMYGNMYGEMYGTSLQIHDHPYGDGSKPYPPVVHIKIAGKWIFIPLKMVLIGIDPHP